jgi:hypothetical protein
MATMITMSTKRAAPTNIPINLPRASRSENTRTVVRNASTIGNDKAKKPRGAVMAPTMLALLSEGSGITVENSSVS